MPFTISKADSLLSSTFSPNCYIGLSKTAPSEDGSNFTEPVGGGYARAKWGTQSKKDKQISNQEIIFFFEALSSLGTMTHFGIFGSPTGGEPYFYGELTSPITVNSGYVPLIRAGELVIGLDKDSLEPGV